MEIYQRVLGNMPQVFSTNEYLQSLKREASSPNDVNRSKYLSFIKKECRKVSNRTYIKRPKEVQLYLEPINQTVITEDMAVELLKNLGYKVLKPVKDWVEI
jgi:hypothetical protein